jgi:hypothetical protein
MPVFLWINLFSTEEIDILTSYIKLQIILVSFPGTLYR